VAIEGHKKPLHTGRGQPGRPNALIGRDDGDKARDAE
jgi:hypothetical protein